MSWTMIVWVRRGLRRLRERFVIMFSKIKQFFIGGDFLICLLALSSICRQCMANQLKKLLTFFCTKSMPCAQQMSFWLKRIDEHGNYITEHCTEETARRATEFRLRARLALHVQHDLHRALPAEGDGQQRLQAGQATHSGSYLTWNFFFLSMSSDFWSSCKPYFEGWLCSFRLLHMSHKSIRLQASPWGGTHKKNRNIKKQQKIKQIQKNNKQIQKNKKIMTLCPGCGRGGLAGRRSCLPVAQLPAGKAERSCDERHVDHLPLGSVHLPPLQQGGPECSLTRGGGWALLASSRQAIAREN